MIQTFLSPIVLVVTLIAIQPGSKQKSCLLIQRKQSLWILRKENVVFITILG